MRTASAGRGRVRGSLVTIKRIPGVMRAAYRVAGGRSIETHETVRTGDHIVQEAQAAERGLFTHRDMATLCAIRAGEQFQSVRLELVQARVAEASDRFVDAIEVNGHAVRQRRFRQANAVGKVRMVGRNGDQHAQFFGGQRHAASLVVMSTNTMTFAARDFLAGRGASDAHLPKWICKERATKAGRKRTAARRVAPNLAWGCVARRLQTHCGECALLAPCPRPNWAQRTPSYLRS